MGRRTVLALGGTDWRCRRRRTVRASGCAGARLQLSGSCWFSSSQASSGLLRLSFAGGSPSLSLASTFRELFHFAWPAWLIACALCGTALGNLSPAVRRLAYAAILLPTVILWIPRDYASQLENQRTPNTLARSQDRLAAFPGSARYVIFPSVDPVSPVGDDGFAGYDNDAVPIGTHPVANVQEPSPILVAALSAAERDRSTGRAWLNDLGITAAFSRPRAALAQNRRPSIHATAAASARGYFR